MSSSSRSKRDNRVNRNDRSSGRPVMARFEAWAAVAGLVAGAGLLGAAGCGFEAGPSAFDDQELAAEDNDDEQPAGDELGGGSGAGTLAGTWLMAHQASSCVIGQEQVSTAYYLVEIEEEGAALRENRRLCDLNASEILGFRPVASAQTLESVSFPQVDRGIISSLVPGAHYASSTAVGLWGIELDDPMADEVPTDGDDPAVIDGDGDGNPGVTMALEGSGCDRYMGQRQIVRFSGRLEQPNDIRGTSVHATETVVYGASGSVCELAPQVASNDEYSRFRMVRIDGRGGAVDAAAADDEPIGCDDISPYVGQLLEDEDRPPNDDHC